MPKRFLMAAAAISVLAFAACSNYNPYAYLGIPATPTPSPSYSPNPSITTANVTFSVGGTPIPGEPVAVSTPGPNGGPGMAIQTVTTNSSGVAAFTNLTYNKIYCFLTPPTGTYTAPGVQPQSYSACVGPQIWQVGVTLGNP